MIRRLALRCIIATACVLVVLGLDPPKKAVGVSRLERLRRVRRMWGRR